MLKKINIVLIALLITVGCASTSKLSVNGKATLYADEVTRDLGLLQSTSISLTDAHVLSEADTRLVVTYVKASVKTIKEVPNGWYTLVSNGLDNLYNALSITSQTKLAQYFSTIKTVLALTQ